MPSPLELFVFPATLYPRRVLIYLQEKGLANTEVIEVTTVGMSETGQMTAPGKPAGSVPILKLPDGNLIKQSIAISGIPRGCLRPSIGTLAGDLERRCCAQDYARHQS